MTLQAEFTVGQLLVFLPVITGLSYKIDQQGISWSASWSWHQRVGSVAPPEASAVEKVLCYWGL